MENTLSVGELVKINPIYRTKEHAKMVKDKTGIVEKIHFYPNEVYKITYDSPYTVFGYIVTYDYYYRKELIRL